MYNTPAKDQIKSELISRPKMEVGWHDAETKEYI